MSTLKRYNSSTSAWEQVTRGAQGKPGLPGPSGPAGSAGAASNALTPMSINDGLMEWWIYPVATYVPSEERTVFGAYSTYGQILVNEMNHKTGELTRTEVATTNKIDDHNNPGVHVEAGRRILIGYTNHNSDHFLRFKVSNTLAEVSSLVDAPEQNYNAGVNVTYTQIHKIESLSDASKDVFWVFYRHNSINWNFVPVTVTQLTGTVTFGTSVAVCSTTVQTYISTAKSNDGDEKIRISWYHNPAQAIDGIAYLEIDTNSGSVTSPVDGTTSLGNAKTNTSLPVTWDEITKAIPEPASTVSRRMFYVRPGPISPAILYAEWDESDPDAAVYHLAEADPTGHTWKTTSYGPTGPRLGYTGNANYVGGGAFPDPCYDNNFVLCKSVDGRDTLNYYHKSDNMLTSLTVMEDSKNRLVRPMVPLNGGPVSAIVNQVESYDSFAVYSSDITLLTEKAPAVATTTAVADNIPVISTEGKWTVYNHGSYKVWRQRIFNMNTGPIPSGNVANGGITNGTFDMPIGYALEDVFIDLTLLTSDDGDNRYFVAMDYPVDFTTKSATHGLVVRNLTTSSISMVDGKVDITLTEKL